MIFSDAVVGLLMDGYSVNEDAGAVKVCIDSGVTGGFQANLTVTLNTTDGTACELFLHSFSCMYVCILHS